MAKLAAVPKETQSSEDRIREMVEGFAAAVRAKDISKMMSYYSPDIVCFDMMPPLKLQGIDAYRKSWEKGLSMMKGPIEFEPGDLQISASGDLGFCHAINR